jgi:hypothetical protein
MDMELVMKGFISKLQKDLNKLQDTLQKEGADLVQKVKNIADKEAIEVKAKEIEKLIAAKLKKFEPAFESLLREIKKGASSAGVDLSKLEKGIKSRTSAAKSRISKAKSKVVKKTAAVKKKASAKPQAKARSKKAAPSKNG